VFQSAPIGVGQIDARGRLTALNVEFARLLDVPIHDALEMALPEIPSSVAGALREIVRAARDSRGISRRTIGVGLPPDRRWLDVVGWASSGPDGSTSVRLLVSEVKAEPGSASLPGFVERARLARDIHDGLAQDLWLAKLTAVRLSNHPGLDSDGRALCADLLRSIDAGLTEATTVFTALRSVGEPTTTLSELVERQVEEFSDRFGVRVECLLTEVPPLPAHVSVEILRVLQEALNNVRKHAVARQVIVRVDQKGGAVTLTVKDDGVGFAAPVGADGYGLQGMHERARSIGGRLTVSSVPGRGTIVTLRVPTAQLTRKP
jgi:signal transduction histidine kinase